MNCRAKEAALSQMMRLTAGAKPGPKFSLGVLLVFFLAYFYALPPAYAIERFTDENGTIHISNIPSEKKLKPEKPKGPPQPALAGPVQPEARQGLPPEPVSTCQGPKGDPGVPGSQNISEPPPVPPAGSPPGPPPPAATRDERAPKPPVKPEKEPKRGKEAAMARADKAPVKDPPVKTETPRDIQVQDIDTPQVQEEAEPDFIPETVATNSIGCYHDFRGILHITNVSTTEPVNLAELHLTALQPDSRQPEDSPEDWSKETRGVQVVALRAESWEDLAARAPVGGLAESNRAGGTLPGTIRIYRDSRSIIYVENTEPEDPPMLLVGDISPAAATALRAQTRGRLDLSGSQCPQWAPREDADPQENLETQVAVAASSRRLLLLRGGRNRSLTSWSYSEPLVFT